MKTKTKLLLLICSLTLMFGTASGYEMQKVEEVFGMFHAVSITNTNIINQAEICKKRGDCLQKKQWFLSEYRSLIDYHYKLDYMCEVYIKANSFKNCAIKSNLAFLSLLANQ